MFIEGNVWRHSSVKYFTSREVISDTATDSQTPSATDQAHKTSLQKLLTMLKIHTLVSDSANIPEADLNTS